jgi:hypothetical protein
VATGLLYTCATTGTGHLQFYAHCLEGLLSEPSMPGLHQLPANKFQSDMLNASVMRSNKAGALW